MEIVDEQKDDALLEAGEVAEETLGSMDYEFWNCPACGEQERFDVKLGGYDRCHQCSRLTMKTRTTVVSAATYTSTGQEKVESTCYNQACNYHDVSYRTIPRKTPPSKSSSSSSHSHGSGSSSRSGYGGGHSRGGGSSRGW